LRDIPQDPVAKTRKLYGEDVVQRYEELHLRSGHAHVRSIIKAVSGANPAWTNTGLTLEQIRRAGRKFKCPYCILVKGNHIKKPINLDPSDFDTASGDLTSRNAEPGEIISADPVGPINPITREGFKWFFLFKDVCTGFDHVVMTEDKSAESFLKAVDYVVKWYRKFGKVVKKIRTDYESFASSKLIYEYYDRPDINIIPQMSIPYEHWQNAVERDVQTVVKGASVLLHSQPWLRADCWDLALHHFINVRNHTPNSRASDSSPYQRITGKALNFRTDFQFAFGDFVAVNVPKDQLNWKFDAKNKLAIYVGCPEHTKSGNLVYWPFSHSTAVRLSCIKVELTDSQLLQYHARLITMREKPLPYTVIEKAVADFRRDEIKEATNRLPEQEWNELFAPVSVPLVPEPRHVLDPVLKKPRVSFIPAPSERVLRSAAGLSSSAEDTEDPARIYPITFESESVFAGAAMTVNQALRRDDADAWKADMLRELNLLFDGGTMVPWHGEMPPSYDLIHSTMALKYKLKQDGSLDKIKARLCACGNELRGSGVETYSPTIGALSYVVAHQISIIDRMHRCTVDVTGAYLYQDYPDDAKPIFLTIPENVATACGLDPTVKILTLAALIIKPIPPF
jgi:hypothetical protein